MRGIYEGKYEALNRYLQEHEVPSVTMTFAEIEALLKAPLPDSASKYQAWWANQNRGQSLAWVRAGYRTSELSIANGRVTFVREDQFEGDPDEAAIPTTNAEPAPQPLTIVEAKVRLAQTFGVDPSQIEITIRA